jgi:hypothetical protein
VVDEVENGVVDTPVFEPAATNVDAPYLTKATWRPSRTRRKLIKRVQNWGGRTVAPPAFLEAAKRTWFAKGYPNHKTCSATKKDGKPCGMRALKGMSVCGAHGGQLALARQGRLQKSGRAAAAIAAKEAAKQDRLKMPEGRPSDVPPLDLTRLRIYVEASERQRIRLAMAFGTDSWFGVVMSMKERERDDPGDDRNR